MLVLNNISSGYSTGAINDNFRAIQEYVNNNLLNRDGVNSGQPNQMEVALDMNGNPIINVSFPQLQALIQRIEELEARL